MFKESKCTTVPLQFVTFWVRYQLREPQHPRRHRIPCWWLWISEEMKLYNHRFGFSSSVVVLYYFHTYVVQSARSCFKFQDCCSLWLLGRSKQSGSSQTSIQSCKHSGCRGRYHSSITGMSLSCGPHIHVRVEILRSDQRKIKHSFLGVIYGELEFPFLNIPIV